ncbi:MAG TPA: FAD-binding oxidoreductase [Thermoplasmata archaeon]|nr:FAD-binding oxidoreductase [Thermoplasmata archaeon]
MFESVRKTLVALLDDDRVLWRRADLEPYTTDADIVTIRKGEDTKYHPDLVVLPRDTPEVQKVVELAAKHKIPLLPKGGGSNRTGMLLPTKGGIVIDTIQMNKVREISVPDLYVTVQSGITLKELDAKLAEHGLALNQEQGSYKVATVGGAISTAGFGRKHQKYGTISDRIMSLEVVLADGSVMVTGPKVLYTSTGYRLHQLFVGAEGTLGVITEATLRVEPLPEATDVVLGLFHDFKGAFGAANALVASGMMFASSEAYETDDPTEYSAPADRKGIFYVSLEGTKGEVEAEARHIKDIIDKHGGILASQQTTGQIFGKYTIQWCGARATSGFEEDFLPYVPIDRVEEAFDRIWNDIMPRHGITPTHEGKLSVDVGRYKMIYGKFCIPLGDEGWRNYRDAYREILEMAVSMGGSIAGCTGIGIKHKEYLGLEYSDTAIEMMWRLKDALDPNNIMNPGKKLPDRGPPAKA